MKCIQCLSILLVFFTPPSAANAGGWLGGLTAGRGEETVYLSTTLDRSFERPYQLGMEAFAEGNLDDASKQFRRAWLRAWAMDDPYVGGLTAYNLAAVLVAREKPYQAIDYLVDARAQLRRAGCSTANAWLLESKISLGLCDEPAAAYAVFQARRQRIPCDCDQPLCQCGPGKFRREVDCQCPQCDKVAAPAACGQDDDRCLERLPCVGKTIRKNRENEVCRNSHQARLQLAAARVALASGNVPLACRRLRCAASFLIDVCDASLSADVQDVAAAIALEIGDDAAAVRHLDRQVEYLRFDRQYREIPKILMEAANIEARRELFASAAGRYNRAARIYFVRGDLKLAWQLIQQASEWVQAASCQTIAVRLAITASEVSRTLDRQRREEAPAGGLVHDDEPAIAPESPSQATPMSGDPANQSWNASDTLGGLILQSPMDSSH